MATRTLRELYYEELQDLYAAERQIAQAFSRLASIATATELKAAFERDVERRRVHVERLELLFDEYNQPKTGSRVTAIEALLQDADRRVQAMEDPDVRDAALIAAAQLVEHYEIAAYGCARTYAVQLGDAAAGELLQQTLDDERATDKQLSEIATVINAVANPDSDRQPRSSLRYLGAQDFDLATHQYADHHIENTAGDQLGKVTGLLIDTEGRPHYLVVDAGGLFHPHRYVVPTARVTLNRSARIVTIDLDKDKLKRYPEFHADQFMAMTPEEAHRYEWHVLDALDGSPSHDTAPESGPPRAGDGTEETRNSTSIK
jgi:ferritin-like metal-binding protein YciE